MKLAVYNWNSCLDEIIPELAKRHTLVEDYKKADRLVVWNESPKHGWADWIKYAQKRGKKSILYQQGAWGMDWVRPPFSEPIISDIICVWGEGDKEKLIEYGTPAEKIKITGSPILKHLKPRVPHEGKNVVFALEHWDLDAGDVVENLIISSELRKLDGVKIITKGLLRENEMHLFQNPVVSNRFGGDHFKIVADVLSTADLVIGITEGTFQFLAEYLDIPVVVPDVWTPKIRGKDPRYLDFKANISSGVTKVPLNKLNETILWQLKHPETKRKERLENVKRHLGVDIKDPTQELINIIENG